MFTDGCSVFRLLFSVTVCCIARFGRHGRVLGRVILFLTMTGWMAASFMAIRVLSRTLSLVSCRLTVVVTRLMARFVMVTRFSGGKVTRLLMLMMVRWASLGM